MEYVKFDCPMIRRINNLSTHEKFVLSINNVELLINKSVAVAISEKISDKFQLDKSISKISIITEIRSPKALNILNEILQNGKAEFENDQILLVDLLHIGIDLDIQELISLYKQYVIDETKIDEDNCIHLLEFYIQISSEEKITECVDFISSHFYSIDENELIKKSKTLGFEILQNIIRNEKLVIDDEDSIASSIISLTKESEIFYPLLEYIKFEFCSEQILDELQNLTNENNCIYIVKSFHDSLVRAKMTCPENPRFIGSKEILSKIDTLKNSDDISEIYKFFDNLSKESRRKMISKAIQEGLCQKNFHGFTIFHIAILDGNLKLVKYLISVGVDKDAKANIRAFLLHFGDEDESILEGINDVLDNEEIHPLHFAAASQNLEIVQYLISIGADKNAKTAFDVTPLHVAAASNNLEIVQYLISIGADKDAKAVSGVTPFHCALVSKKLEIIQYLNSIGVDKDAKFDNRFIDFLQLNDKDETKYIFEVASNKAPKTDDGMISLHLLASDMHSFNEELAKYLISIGADKNAKSENGYTPLHIASKFDNLEMVEYLISIGADKSIKTKDGKTPLSVATDRVREYLSSL
ncbi:hypothetical protein TVAG_152220 [Trichomonas vaginalis G3]|uniref:Uncharacterized protein n=1 Tax=Trichomonas vaginalis (strain ATCC PRA-98 / G3) TaxID=412133 RepID=A2F6Z8_TRIV3|nr:spectrin binding [Trichomonas vaginalis G3]EAX99303.1 hypothetical protein TVAG_152220 [Trichomonas vaginalis G3]KAI5500137.1 spectrin binding [Trichomonas vaginalis G3]|eukprot:XP_001312233.1 hypothetical protein [Trichomonas vaginalis G3]